MGEKTKALECKSLTKQFGNLIAVDQLSFEVQKQNIFGLIGPNGAGKSTLMKMLTTLLFPTSGDALIDNISIIKNPSDIRKIVGYVPQLISADGNLTGYENLLLFCKLYQVPKKEREKKIYQSLEIMGLLNFAHRYVSEYSGGMVRRLEIILALLHRPKILFLDEPTTGLDPVARRTVWKHLLEIHKKEKITIILTTHDMQEADYLCETVAIMLRGKIVKIGKTESLKSELGEGSTLNDVFIQYAGNEIETENSFKETISRRRTEHKRG